MRNSNIVARIVPVADFRPAANAAAITDEEPQRFVQQQQNLGCPKIAAIKAQQAQAQSPQL